MKHFLFAALTLSLFMAAITQTACYYDNEQELYGGNVTCDTIAVSYLTDIKPIIDANCISCHAPGGEQESSPLLTYDDLKKYTDDRNIVDRTQGTSSLMPPAGRMSNCNVAKITAWVNQGALNN